MDINGNHMLWTELSSPQIPTLKLHPPLWLLEDSIFKEATEVKWGHKGGALNQQDQCPGKQKRQQGCDHNRENAMWGHSEKAATKGPREKTSPANTLIGLPASRTVSNKFLAFKLSSPWYFVMAALAH